MAVLYSFLVFFFSFFMLNKIEKKSDKKFSDKIIEQFFFEFLFLFFPWFKKKILKLICSLLKYDYNTFILSDKAYKINEINIIKRKNWRRMIKNFNLKFVVTFVITSTVYNKF